MKKPNKNKRIFNNYQLIFKVKAEVPTFKLRCSESKIKAPKKIEYFQHAIIIPGKNFSKYNINTDFC